MSHIERGQALVELALVLPIVLMTLMGVVDLGRVYFFQVSIANAAREGVRVASIATSSNSQIRDATRNETSSTMSLSDSQIEIDPPASRMPGKPVTVTVTFAFDVLTPVMSLALGQSSFSVSTSATAVVQ